MALHLIEKILVLGTADGVPAVRDVLIDGDRYAVVTPRLDVSTAAIDERTDGRGKLLLPGLVNAHHHSHDRFDKGRFSPLPLELWMSLYNPPGHARGWTADEVYLRTLLCGVEMLRGGITAVVDDIHFGPRPEPALVEAAFNAYRDLGLRADVAVAWCDLAYHQAVPYLTDSLPPALQAAPLHGASHAGEVLDLWHSLAERWDGRVRFVLSASAPQRCSPGFLQQASALAGTLQRPLHLHLLETRVQALTAEKLYGTSMVKHMQRLGVLDARCVLAHGVWVSQDDLALIAEAGATVVHNPACNMKLGSGLAPVAAMLQAGINVALGTDNNNGNDTNSMFDAMRLACFAGALLHDGEAPEIDAECALRLATCGGARAMGAAGSVGCVAPGHLADFAIIDSEGTSWAPATEPLEQLVFGQPHAAVTELYVGGRRLVDGGRVTSIDEAGLARELAERAESLHAKLVGSKAAAQQLRPYLLAAYRRCLGDPAMVPWRRAANLIQAERTGAGLPIHND